MQCSTPGCGRRICFFDSNLLCDHCEKKVGKVPETSPFSMEVILARLEQLQQENSEIRGHLKQMYHETKYPLPNDDLLKRAEALERENDFLREKQAENVVQNDLQTKLNEARFTKTGVILDLSEKARNSLKVSEAQALVEEMQHVNALPDEEFLQALPKLEKASEMLSKVTVVGDDKPQSQSRLHLPTKASQARADEVKKSHSAKSAWKR